MFDYFPDNYIWNMSVIAALIGGGQIDEIDRACRPLRDIAKQGENDGTLEFFESWSGVVDTLVAGAESDEEKGRIRSARQKYARAANYLAVAERMLSRDWEGRLPAYRRVLELFDKGEVGWDCERVEVPFGDSALPGYLRRPHGVDGAVPCVIQWNGLDSTKEMMYQTGFAAELAARGIATLVVDTPGSGEALRLRGLTAIPETEVWAAACVDYLTERTEIDVDRIGIVGWSLGGYFAPRAAAFEKRLALCVAWGANYNWGALQRGRLRNQTARPVAHYWDHAMWVWGASSMEEFQEIWPRVTLEGVVEEITVPLLVTHGEKDRQIPVEDARLTYEHALNSPKRELRIFTTAEGAGVEHISVDNIQPTSAFTADWIAETFAGR